MRGNELFYFFFHFVLHDLLGIALITGWSSPKTDGWSTLIDRIHRNEKIQKTEEKTPWILIEAITASALGRLGSVLEWKLRLISWEETKSIETSTNARERWPNYFYLSTRRCHCHHFCFWCCWIRCKFYLSAMNLIMIFPRSVDRNTKKKTVPDVAVKFCFLPATYWIRRTQYYY